MKKIFIAVIAMCSLQQIQAQDVFDALRYSYQPVTTGSARIQAIGGANISLGGDISSAFINPAGLGQFKTNEIVLSPGFNLNSDKMLYNDKTTTGKKNKMNFGASGIILSWGSRFNENASSTMSFAINRAANYNSGFSYGGRNLNSSYSFKWIEEIDNSNASSIDDIRKKFPLGASQAYESYLLDLDSLGRLFSYASTDKNLDQQFSYQTAGGMTEAAFAMAWNRNNKFLYGITIGIPIINYERKTTVTEKDGTGNTNNDFESFIFTENLKTTGTGFNAKLGLIFKPVEYFRIGLTFHSPSLISLKDVTDASVTSNIENLAKRLNNDPNKPTSYTYNTYDINSEAGINGSENIYNYQLTTPWKLGASLSYVFREINDVTKQKAFITGDFELVNYKAMSYSSSENVPDPGEVEYFKGLNTSIDDTYKMTFNAKIGGELKFETIMVRAGFNYMGSPFSKDFIGDSDIKGWRMTPSLGIGYRDKGMFLDLTYAHSFGRSFHVPYTLSNPNYSYPYAKDNYFNGQIVATVGFKF
ncbi:MAG: hypothetical protein QM725_03495 [Lacibacter sp.]